MKCVRGRLILEGMRCLLVGELAVVRAWYGAAQEARAQSGKEGCILPRVVCLAAANRGI